MNYRIEFLEFAIRAGVLRFGDFTLKSGRQSPYFFNAGLFNTGKTLAELGRYYARAITDAGLPFDMLFGPAYKGIPLVASVAIALAGEHEVDVPWAFNRKEAKTHGEGGDIVGAPLRGRVLIVDDVITAGTAIREAVEILHAHGSEPAGVAIALDRQERGRETRSAIQEVEHELGVHAIPIATLADLVTLVQNEPGYSANLDAINAYRQRYGI